MAERVGVGIVGCGNVSGVYVRADARFDCIKLVACADLDLERARARAAEHGRARVCTVDQLLDDPAVRIVVNLTTPQAHFAVTRAALEAGKCVYVEKPLALTRDEGRELLALARSKGLLLGGAPDTFMGAAHQTARKLVDDGAVGRPVAACAFMMGRGHEGWHPAPDFYYLPGGGPMFDMGPYYVTALVNMLGPVARVTGSTGRAHDERVIGKGPRAGERIPVEVATHVAATLEFASGAVATLVTSFDVAAGARLPQIQVYGTAGSIDIPTPNGFGGAVSLRRPDDEDWSEVALTHANAENSRGAGAADMARGLVAGRPHRASGELAYHVLDVMQAALDSAESGRRIDLESSCARPAALPPGLADGELD